MEPIEIKNLFNPAFLSSMLAISIQAYQSSKNAFPYSLSFLILPLILHKNTRDTLPNSANASFHKWINSNQQVKINFEDRVEGLSSKIKSAIIMGTKGNLFKFDKEGRLHSIKKINVNKIWANDSEIVDIAKKASVLGKIFSKMDALEIYALLGVRP